jgi:HK97 family phage prohead protease
MDKILHVASTFKSHENDDGSVMIRGMASTNHSDRAGDVISAEAWTKGGLENFKNNPVILFNHDYDKPIGRATGVKVTENGLELEAKISKSAPAAVCELVKDGVLGAFSVGFKVKDADYLKETDGLMIKDAELFEVSVVSVPCNQAATFSLAKSFDSVDEYEAFKKTFTNRVDLPGQSLTKDDSKESNLVSDAPKHVEQSTNKETKMSEDNTPAIDLEAFAKKVAEETAAKIAMKQAEQKAADEAQQKAAADAVAEKAAEQEAVQKTIRTGIETGAEKLMADVQADMEKASVDQIAEVTAKYEAELKEKAQELEAMRNSKRDFSGRQVKGDVSAFAKDFMHGHMLSKITGKSLQDTSFGRDLLEKAGVDYLTSAGSIDTAVSTQIEKEVELELRAANLFREINVNSQATVLPIAPEAAAAQFVTSAADGNLTDGAAANTYRPQEVTLKAYRLMSTSFIDNWTDEQVLVNLLPMITDGVARAHARAVDGMILNGVTDADPNVASNQAITGLAGHAASSGTGASFSVDISEGETLTGTTLMNARSKMGKYGINPSDVAYIVPTHRYFELVSDSGFADITDVGSDLATKINGVIGTVFGSPVIVSDAFAAETPTAGETVAYAVNTRNFVIPRLRGVNVESDYQVAAQRNLLVASQSLGFNQLIDGTTNDQPCVKVVLVD